MLYVNDNLHAEWMMKVEQIFQYVRGSVIKLNIFDLKNFSLSSKIRLSLLSVLAEHNNAHIKNSSWNDDLVLK